MIFTQYLVVFLVGISLIGLLTADFVRILKPELYPLKAVNHILKEKELHMRLGPQISMAVGCFSIIILFGIFQPLGPLIICTSMTMAIAGDIGSNLVGRTIGSRFKKIQNTDKTYLGLIAGILCAIISGYLILILLNSFFIIPQNKFYLFPLIGALIIGILDYIDLEVDDNLSFILITASALFFISFFLI
jgi:CDP-diglyceride synthetase